MKKGRSHGNPRNPSCFYKLILFPANQSNKLRIPEVFSRALSDEHTGIATLTVPTGESWEVSLLKEDDSLWFCEGWREFVEYFSIGFAYFLMFLYEGNSEFKVHIFSPTACEIKYPCNARKIPQGKSSPLDDDDDDDDVDDVICFSPSNASNDLDTEIIILDNEDDDPMEKGEDVPSDGSVVNLLSSDNGMDCHRNEGSMNGNQGTQYVNDENQSKSIPEESCIQIQSDGLMKALCSIGISMPKNPFFVTLIKQYHFKSCFVSVPTEFAQKYICSTAKLVKVEALSGNQREVCVKRSQCGGFRLSNGWIDFVRENRLNVGDICVYELIDAQNRVLKVHVGNKSQLENEQKWRRHILMQR